MIPAAPAEQERLLERLFPQIATLDTDTGEWKRRVASRQALGSFDPGADATVSHFIEARLLRSDTCQNEAKDPQEMVEVAHEAILRQ